MLEVKEEHHSLEPKATDQATIFDKLGREPVFYTSVILEQWTAFKSLATTIATMQLNQWVASL